MLKLSIDFDLGGFEALIDALEDNGCTQLTSGLLDVGGIGLQVESAGSLNGYHLDNPYVRAIGALVSGDLQGRGIEEVRRTVDVALSVAGIDSDQGERNVLAYLLTEGII